MSTALGITFLGLGIGAFLFALAVYGGIATWLLWGWFMVPLGLPQVGIAWAIGISTLVVLVAPTPPPPPDGKANSALGFLLAKPAIAVAIGWICKQFM